MSRSSRDTRRASRPARAHAVVFDLALAEDALPLVQRVLADITGIKSKLIGWESERRQLRKTSTASETRRRFTIEDEIRDARQSLRGTIDELHQIGVTLLDSVRGEVGFPTIVNGSLAYLYFRVGGEQLSHWRYRDQAKLRPIPPHWRGAPVPSRLEEEEGLLV